MAEFYKQLKKAMDLRNVTQNELCKKTSIPKSAMSQYMSGKFKPKQNRTYLIAKALNVNEAWLMGFEDVPMDKMEEKSIDFSDICNIEPLPQMINKRRRELNLTLEEIGNIVGVSKSTVKKWESGDISNMRRDKIALLAKALKINPVSLITGEENLQSEQIIDTKTSDIVLKQICVNYENLNDIGKNKLLDYSNDLIESGNYTNSI